MNAVDRDDFLAELAPEMRRSVQLHELDPSEVLHELQETKAPGLPRERISAIIAYATSRGDAEPEVQQGDLAGSIHEIAASIVADQKQAEALQLDPIETCSMQSLDEFVGELKQRNLVRDAVPTAQELTAGTMFADYLLLKIIGRGGMGQVFRALHLQMGTIVAVKVASPRAAGVRENPQRFREEIRNLARLKHPNIVAALHAGESQGMPYLVMEHVDGADLAQLVRRIGPLSLPLVSTYAVQAAKGLLYAHQHGVVHRDVKPSNMLVDGQGALRISDLGLAKYLPAEPQPPADDRPPKKPVGTYAFMAPEQADGRQAGPRADVYGLGCTLYFLLVGRPPASGSNKEEMLQWHRDGVIPTLRGERKDVPEQLDALFQSMLSKSPDRRPPLETVIETLEACAKPKLASAKPPGPGWRRWVWLAVALLVPLAALLIWKAVAGPITNSIGMQLVRIPAGEFLMGAAPDEPGSLPDERPQHVVRITQPYCLGAYEVTRRQYDSLMNPEREHPPVDTRGAVDEGSLPVVGVSWDEAVEFCRRLSNLDAEKTAGRSYRLPTEAEWEYACRAGTSTAYWMGDDLTIDDANYGAEHRPPTTKLPGAPRILEVGSLAANPFGLYDMHGNVLEWCRDWSAKYDDDPVDDPWGAKVGDERVIRGGATMYKKAECRSAFRRKKRPYDTNPFLGFRVVCELRMH